MALTKEDLQDIAKVVAEANKSTQSDSYFTLAPEHRNDDCVGKDMVRGAIGFVRRQPQDLELTIVRPGGRQRPARLCPW